MTEPILCRNWTAPDVRAAVALADDDQRAVLREIVLGEPRLLSEIADAMSERVEDLRGRMSGWAKKTKTLGILDPVKRTPSWPWTYERRPGGNAYVVPDRVREIVLEEIGDLPDHRSFVTLWAREQILLMKNGGYEGGPLEHTAGEQFDKTGVRRGDRVYVVGTEHGDLLLVGRLTVGDLLDTAAAREHFGKDDVYEASTHLVGSGTPMAFGRRVPREIVERLERSSGKPFSRPGSGGAVSGNGLRSTGRITAASARLLDGVLGEVPRTGESYALDVVVDEPAHATFEEGARLTALHTQIERSAAARHRAIEIHGTDCMACEFSFEERYGAIGRGYVEVHHLKPITSAGVRRVDPRSDLAVLCSNCHSMAHRRDPPFAIDELREALTKEDDHR